MTEISRNGRTVAVHDLTPNAPADAPVVLLCHSAPGSGSFDPDPDATAAAGVRLLSVGWRAGRPGAVAAEVLLAYGADDERVPMTHGAWYRDRLPSAELQLWPRVGHLLVVPAWQRVLEHLAG